MINGIHRDTWGHKARCFVRVMLLAIGMIWSMQINAQTKDYFKFTSLKDGSKVGLGYYEAQPSNFQLWYSIDKGKNWATLSLTFGQFVSAPLAVGEELWIKGWNPTRFSENGKEWAFRYCSGSLAVSGNIMSIVDSTLQTNVIPTPFYFYRLFDGCTAIKDASGLILPAEELPNDCYNKMFYKCTNLTKGPDMSAVRQIGIASCLQMFSSCGNLTEIIDMPNVTLIEKKGCQSMFASCTTLVKAPNMPNLMTVQEYGCVYMYSGCKALKTVPPLTAQTILEYGYHQMFNNCTALETAPSILATEIITADALKEMYNGCTALKFIEVYFTEWNENVPTLNWTQSVPVNTNYVFSAPCGLPDERNSGSDYSYIPQKWKFVCFSQDCTDVEATLEDSTPICEESKSGE